MAQNFAIRFYSGKLWQAARNAVLRRSGGLCEECYARGIVKPAEAVHHKIFLTPENINDPNITINPENLQALCADCHAKKHERRQKRRYIISKQGEVITKP